MVPTGGELDDAKMAELLRLRIETGERSPDSFVHEMDVYSGEPEHIISGLNHAPGTDLGDGKGKAWCFYSPASWLESAGVGHKRRRKRQVGGARGGDGVRCWHQEKKGRMFGSSPHGSAYSTTFSYVLKEKNPVGSAKPFSFKRLGWSMTEIIDAGAADNLMFCKLYRSTRTNPEMARTVRRQRGTAGVEVDRKFTLVMEFGESSMPSAVGMKEVASLIRRITKEEKPVVVLSAMKTTTNNLLLAARQASSCDAQQVCEIRELKDIKKLHLSTVRELQLDRAVVSGALDLLEQQLKSVARTKELTPKTQDYILSFGERLSTGILSAYLNKLETAARQYDELDLGMMTIGKYTDIVESTYSAIAERLEGDWINEPAVPILAGFLGKEWGSCGFTALGRGGGNLTANIIGRALGSKEIKIWNDVDGVLTWDPTICSTAKPLPFMAFDEETALAYFRAQVNNFLWRTGVKVHMISQGLSNSEALHSSFFENDFLSEVEGAEKKFPADSSTTVINGKADDDLPEGPSSVQERADTETRLHPPPVGEGSGDPTEVFDIICDDNIAPVAVDHGWDMAMWSMWSANMERMLSDSEEILSDDTQKDWRKYLSGIVDGHGNWIPSGGNDGAGPSGVVAGEPEDGQFLVRHEQPANAPAASGNYP